MFKYNPDSNTFVVRDTLVNLRWRPVSTEEAEQFGVEGCTHALIGSAGGGWKHYGTLTPVTGKLVRVPGWSKERRGYLAEWRRGDGESTFKGWVGE